MPAAPKRQPKKSYMVDEEEEQRWKKIEDRLTIIEKYVGRIYKILSSLKKN
jgi:hypothetical protein